MWQLYHVHLVAAVERPGLLSAPDAPMLEAARAWRESASLNTGVSALHRSVSACLSAMGIVHNTEHWCEHSEHSVDIAIDVSGQRTAVEVDGPSHFLHNGQPNGRTQLRNRCLAAHGWRVVVVPFYAWDALGTKQQREAYLTRLLA